MKPSKSLLRVFFGGFMVLFYILVAILLVFTPFFEGISLVIRIIMAVLFSLYGIFRAYRLYRDLE